MGYVIDTTEKENINLAPGTVEEEVIQNLWFLYSSLEYDVPLDRALGLNATYIDKPIEAAKALPPTASKRGIYRVIFPKSSLWIPTRKRW